MMGMRRKALETAGEYAIIVGLMAGDTTTKHNAATGAEEVIALTCPTEA
jgi:hypothetical protein